MSEHQILGVRLALQSILLKQVASEGDVLSLPDGQSLAIVDILPPF